MMTYLPHFTILIVLMMVAPFCSQRIRMMNSVKLEATGKPWKSPIIPWLVFFGYIALLAGMRSGMNDTSVYIGSYMNGPTTWNGVMEAVKVSDIKYAAWALLQGICRIILGLDYHRFFLLVAFFEAALFIWVLRREAVDYTVACFFFFASGLYYNNFSMMRQWLAVTIVFTSIGALRDKKFIKYTLICFIGGLFHPSAWMCIPIYFLVQGEPWSNKQILLTFLFVLILLFLNPILSMLSSFADDSMYSYALETMTGNNGSSIIRPIIAVVPVILAYLFHTGYENRTYKVCVNMAVLNTMLSFLAAFTSGLFVMRFATYVGIFNVLLFPYLLNNKKCTNLVKYAFYVFYLILFIYSNTHAGSWGYKSDVLTWLTNY